MENKEGKGGHFFKKEAGGKEEEEEEGKAKSQPDSNYARKRCQERREEKVHGWLMWRRRRRLGHKKREKSFHFVLSLSLSGLFGLGRDSEGCKTLCRVLLKHCSIYCSAQRHTVSRTVLYIHRQVSIPRLVPYNIEKLRTPNPTAVSHFFATYSYIVPRTELTLRSLMLHY